MALLDSRFFLQPPLQQVIFDKTLGTLLSGGTVNFYANYERTIPKVVYELSAAPGPAFTYNALGSSLTLSGIGSFVDETGKNITPYLYPYTGTPTDNTGVVEYYFIDVLDANGSLQFTVDAYPNIGDTGTQPTSFSDADNKVINPQFVNVLWLGASNTYTVSGTNTSTAIAPGWNVVTTGSGTFTVTQTAINDPTVPSNPPYALSFTGWTGSITNASLVQNFTGSPRLLGGNYVNSYFVAKTLTGSPLQFNLFYALSGQTPTLLSSGLTSANAWTVMTSNPSVLIPDAGTDTAPTGSAQLSLTLPVNSTFSISSFQLVGVSNASSTLEFIEESNAQQVNGLFNYYQPQLKFKPSPSLLVGWDFPLNPAQFAFSNPISTAKYIWDQTICASALGSVSASTSLLNDGLVFSNSSPGEAFYILQYLDQSTIQNMLGNPMSVNIFGWADTTDVKVRVYLCRGSSGSIFPALPTTIGSIGPTGVFTLTGGNNWSFINPLYYTDTSGNLSKVAANSDINNVVDLQFPGFQITDNAQISDTNKFAIIVTFYCPTVSTTITLNSISVTQGMIPTRPAPQSVDEVLRECRRFYEMTYNSAADIGLGNKPGSLVFAQNASANGSLVRGLQTGFTIKYNVIKRASPTINFYSDANGTLGQLTAHVYGNVGATSNPVDNTGDVTVSNIWQILNSPGLNAASYVPILANFFNNTPVSVAASNTAYYSAHIAFHCTIDARFGVV